MTEMSGVTLTGHELRTSHVLVGTVCSHRHLCGYLFPSGLDKQMNFIKEYIFQHSSKGIGQFPMLHYCKEPGNKVLTYNGNASTAPYKITRWLELLSNAF